MYYFVGKLINVKLGEVLKSFGGNMMIAAVMGVITYFIYTQTLSVVDSHMFIAFIIAVFVGVLLYLALSWLVNRDDLYAHVSMVKSLRK